VELNTYSVWSVTVYHVDRMATSLSVNKCPICQEDVKDPRLLPCIHSFCLECLENYCRSESKLPGDDVPCPECRHEFQIPEDGVAGLTVRTHDKESAHSASPGHQGGDHYCIEHRERVKIYCFDCQKNMCSMCYYELHKNNKTQHKSERIDVVVQEFPRHIDDEIKQVTSRIESFRATAAHVEAESCKLLGRMQATEREIKNKGEEVKQSFTRLIDRQVSDLLHKLQSMKSAAEKEVQLQTDAVQLALTELESFRTSSEMKSKGSPSDITQASGDVRVRTKELLQKHVIPGEYHAPSYKFTPVNTDQLLRDDQNFVGHVTEVNDPGMCTVIVNMF